MSPHRRSAVPALLAAVALALPLLPGVPDLPGPLAGPARADALGPGDRLWAHEYGGGPATSSPVVADVDGDGVAEIVLGHVDGKVRVLDAATGLVRHPWDLPGRGETPAGVDSSPAVADLDRDGTNEVVVGYGTLHVPGQPGGLAVFAADGTWRCGVTTSDIGRVWIPSTGIPDGFPEPVYSSPAVGDVDGDGYPDVVFGGFDNRIHAVDRTCQPLPGFPYDVEDSVWSSPALHDVDGDGRMEIFVGGDQTPGGYVDWAGGELHALDWQGGVVPLWKRQIRDVITSSPAIGDIDGDGRVEVVVGAGAFYGDVEGWHVWAWHADDGSLLPGWPQATGGPVKSSPALADLTGDGRPEVVVGSNDSHVWAWRGDGSPLWKVQPQNCCVTPGPVESSPVTVDVNGDGRQDVVVGNNWATYVLNGPDGAVLAGPLRDGWSYWAAPAVGDVAGLGRLLVTVGFNPLATNRIDAYALPSHGTPDWPTFRRNARRLGAAPSDGPPLPPGFCRAASNPPADPSPASGAGYWFLSRSGGVYAFGVPFYGSFGTIGVQAAASGMAVTPDGLGYWLLAEDGGVFTFGGAAFHGSMGGRPLNGPVVNVAATPTGNGYWLLGADGGVFSFGDARFHGSMGGVALNAPVVALAPTPTGAGYWLLAADGGVFSFGDAAFHGSTGGLRLNAPVISMTPHPGGHGYWLLAADGGVFSFGVPFHGSLPGTGLCRPPAVRQLRATATGDGYWLLGADGGVFSFGDALFLGSAPGLGAGNPAVDMAVRP